MLRIGWVGSSKVGGGPLRAGLVFISLLALVLPIGLAGCGDTAQPDAGFQVALLTPGSIRDQGWNQSAYEGLALIEEKLGAGVAHQETKTPQEFEAGFRDFGARGYDLVFGHGFEFQDAAARVAPEFPDTVFITTSGSTVRKNVAPIVFELEQATYVLGYLGALISRRAHVGAVGGLEVPSVASTFLAYEEGAKAARANTQFTVSYVGSWTDVSAAREATLAQIAGKVDVLIHNANDAARGFFQAVAEEGVYAFGTNKNQNDLAPDVVVASATLDVPRALLLVATQVQEGTFAARVMRFGMADDVVKIEWNEKLLEKLPASAVTETRGLEQRIATGTFRVPRGNF